MNHNSCLDALNKLGADPADIELVAAFLSGRTMSVKVGESMSVPRKAPGGSPQGSILGNFLFCASTNDFITNNQTTNSNEPEPILHEHEENRVSEQSSDGSTYCSDEDYGPNFRFFRKKQTNHLDDTEISFRYSQAQLDNELGVPEKWESIPAKKIAYIDDINIVEKVRHCDALSEISVIKQTVLAHTHQSEEIFKGISSLASEINMRVNEDKTQILCVSAAKNSSVKSYINAQTRRIKSNEELKMGSGSAAAPR